MLLFSPILRLPDLTKPFILRTDASNHGIGAVLLQEHDVRKYPVAYASRKLLDREQRYSVDLYLSTIFNVRVIVYRSKLSFIYLRFIGHWVVPFSMLLCLDWDSLRTCLAGLRRSL